MNEITCPLCRATVATFSELQWVDAQMIAKRTVFRIDDHDLDVVSSGGASGKVSCPMSARPITVNPQ